MAVMRTSAEWIELYNRGLKSQDYSGRVDSGKKCEFYSKARKK